MMRAPLCLVLASSAPVRPVV